MEWAPVVEVGANLGKQKGKLVVSGCRVEWWRYGYVYRQFTMEHPVHSAVFAHYANTTNPQELWVVAACENRLVHSFGISSGKTHIIGLNSVPKSMVPCGEQGIVLTYVEPHSSHLSAYMLQGPEELLKGIVPSSTSAPLRADDDLVFCDDSIAVVWNPTARTVKAYQLRLLQQAHQSLNIKSTTEKYRKAAVLAPVREWPQIAIGKVFSQHLKNVTNDGTTLSLVATHDPESNNLYVLCGPDLMRHEDVKFVSPLAGVHRFPGVATVSNVDSRMSYVCLFFPQVNPLLMPLAINGQIQGLASEQESNWIEIQLQHDRSVRIALASSLDPIVNSCFDIVLELLGPMHTVLWLSEFLALKSHTSSDIKAFAQALTNLSSVTNPTLMSRLIIYLHMLRDELSLLVTNNGATEDLAAMIRPFVSEWGNAWNQVYDTDSVNSEYVHDDDFETSAEIPEASTSKIPCILDSPPNVFASLSYCINPNSTSASPELMNSPKLFPTTILLVSTFQLISNCSSSEEIKSFFIANKFPESIDLFCPGIRTCLLEIMGYVGINPYDHLLVHGKQKTDLAKEDIKDYETPSSEFSRKVDKIIRGLYPQDLRFNEAVHLLQTKTPQKCLLGVYANPKNTTEHQLAQCQKEWGEELASRALATAYGKAAIDMNSKKPLLWEQLEAPFIDFSGECTETGMSIPPVHKSFEMAAESDPWGVFAHGAALGLSICPSSPGIDSLWVITSAQLNSTSPDIYSGFVYGMGLSGHLANLEDWQFYESLVSSNTRGTLAALLGVAASKKSSRDPKLTKVLSVHIRALLPVEAHEAQFVPPEVERAALISLGILYLGQGVRHLTEALIRELQWIPAGNDHLNGEHSEHIEAHKLSVGLTLGLINCGWGKPSGLDQLLSSITGLHDRSVYSAEITIGAICAILLGFVGTNDEIVASQIKLPRTRAAAEYSTPNTFFTRALAYHLIMWDDVGTSEEWIMAHVPIELKVNSGKKNETGVDSLWYYYSLSGVLTAVAMRHTASNNGQVIETLLKIIDKEFYQPYVRNLTKIAEHANAEDENDGEEPNRTKEVDYDLTQTTMHFAQLLSSLALALGAVAAGSGSLPVLRQLRKLWQISSQLQASVANGAKSSASPSVGLDLTCVSQAIGWLFLSSGQRSFNTAPKNIGFLSAFTFLNVIGGPNIFIDEWRHLRFMWSLVTELRCLFAQHDPSEDVEVEIELNSDDVLLSRLPLMLPPLEQVRRVKVIDSRYAPLIVDSDNLEEVLLKGLRLTANETGRHTLESMLPSSKPKANWDHLPIRGLRATLQTIARKPSSLAEYEDLRFLLEFSEMWPADNDSRLLKNRDIEQLKFLRWYSQES